MFAGKENIELSPYFLKTNISISISVIYQHWTKQKERQNKLSYTYKTCNFSYTKKEYVSHGKLIYILSYEQVERIQDGRELTLQE